MGGRMVLYRGSLKSCNYHCSYCPFSKHAMSYRELEKDREQWILFKEDYIKRAEGLGIRALMIVPYGEALIHPWYWEGLAQITSLPVTEAAGAQTNLGFAVEESLDDFIKFGGKPEKLRLWATFHPEMTAAAEFAENCRKCMEKGVRICAGAVGVPKNTDLLKQIRKELPEEIYFWINKMDGLGRPYTHAEKEAFMEIDPYFFRELSEHPADVSGCRERLFVEGNQKVRLCSISAAHSCSRKRCSCYLAYGGREEFLNQLLFGPYPLFRIPRRAKAAFLDIEGTLRYPGKNPFFGSSVENLDDSGISEEVRTGLEVLACREKTRLFFATTLPYEEAYRRCRSIRHLFSGGVFAGGAHILLEGVKEYIFFLDGGEEYARFLEPFGKQFHFRILSCRRDGRCYKMTLFRARQNPWNREEAEEVMKQLPVSARERIRYYMEENCLQIVAAGADKAEGARMICQWLGISPKEAFAAGDSAEDARMTALCMS